VEDRYLFEKGVRANFTQGVQICRGSENIFVRSIGFGVTYTGILWGGLHRIVGTRLYERKWSTRVRLLDEVLSSVEHPHRQWLMDQLEGLYPFSSVLEVGCGYGQNIQVLARRFLATEVMGLDINSTAVNEGNLRLAGLGIKRAHLILGKADKLSQFADKSIDIIFTDATLLYIGPDKIKRVISEMQRVFRKALLFLELHKSRSRPDDGRLGVHTPDGWIWDYQELLIQFFRSDSIKLTKIPVDIWPTGRWPIFGHLITVLG